MNILEACHDANLFRPWFKKPETYQAWFAFLAAVFALPMTDEQAAIYEKHTGPTDRASAPYNEAWLVIGRRGGKSFFMALAAVYLACFHEYRRYLAPGERATVMVIASDHRQARVIIRYVAAMLHQIPMLRNMVEREATDSFDLSNQVSIEVGTASFRSTSGYTYAAVLCDEIAFWRTDDAAEPDYAILDALRPGMSSIPNSLLIAASSPYARRGALWDAHKRHFGRAGASSLVWQSATRDMNPTIPQRVIDHAMERDPASASAEYGAQFRTDIEGFVTREVVEACVTRGVRERPRIGGVTYQAFVDPSGGSADSFTLAIGHNEGKTAILDALRERKPPFSPEAVVIEYAELLKSYGVSKVVGDRYAGEWPREVFRNQGITYEPSAKPKSDLYRDLLPGLNSGSVDLLDLDRVVTQIVGLERRTARGGKDSIDHAPGGHDDVANAVAGVMGSLVGKAEAAPMMFLSKRHRPGG